MLTMLLLPPRLPPPALAPVPLAEWRFVACNAVHDVGCKVPMEHMSGSSKEIVSLGAGSLSESTPTQAGGKRHCTSPCTLL
eukprot:NODE_4714_length_647_cov_191.393581.p3 GENE.NODE_4714_length_647_cov_191.393581~~NODE_4714_length_647_cov_191.393581.p3  ORF type:complete len:81 (+),score=13.51 NODE_4714_length_647_cov_191.393581:401-643(+)